MSKYGQVAEIAIGLIHSQASLSPVDAWRDAVRKVFPESKSSQEKGCPRGTFLGLCEAGKISGVPSGKYTKSVANKEYALEALSHLVVNPTLAEDTKLLWSKVMDGQDKKENYQMDVVTALWRLGVLSQ